MPSNPNDLIFDFSLKGRIILRKTAYCKLLDFCQRDNEPETGGVIIGTRESKNRAIFIEDVMEPSLKNKSGKTWLARDRKEAQAYVDKVFSESKGMLNYLGEWHTHPDKDPSPSTSDIKMMKDLLRSSKLEIDFLIGIILGQTGNLCVWYQDASERHEIIHYDIEPSM